MSVIIPRPGEFGKKMKALAEGGLEDLQVLTDFDRTLTKAIINGEQVPSIMKLLRSGPYLSPEYNAAADALAAKYHPIEVNLELPYETRRKAMEEWWTTHFDLLVKSGLNRKHLEQLVSDKKFQFRDGALKAVDYLHKHDVPLVVISSSGIGETIPMLLEKQGRLYDNVHVITNEYNWDKKGNAKSVKGPAIHVMNKDEGALRKNPVFKTIKDRKNVILLGDSIDDLKMIGDFKYDQLLSIGFLDVNTEANRAAYHKAFDVVLEGDESFSYVNEILGTIK